jgi:hypothetical protein
MKNIAVYLMGGFGNQLFQYLHALKLKKGGDKVHLLADWYVKPMPPGTTIRELNLHRLPQVEIPIVFSSDFLERGYILAPFEFDSYDEKLMQFKVGYFQSVSEMPSKEILKNFYAELPVNQKFVGLTVMHLRLGDYVKLGWALPIEYYDNIFRNNPDTQFTIFCEDESETREFLSKLSYKNYLFAKEIDPSMGSDPLADFIALSSARCCYGSNSTFSYLAGLAVGFNGGSYISPNNQYWDWFDRDRLISGLSLLDYDFITRES